MTMTQTTNTIIENVRTAIIETINNTRNTARFLDLEDRWYDECGYEDFSLYTAEMMKCMPKGAKFVKGTTEPFGVVFKLGGKTFHIYLKEKGRGCCLVAKSLAE